MKNATFLSWLVMTLLWFSSCHKDDDDSKIETKAELIADKNWVITGNTSKKNNDAEKDEFAYYDNCDKDDIYRFAKNGTYEVNDGATKCNSADPQVYEQGIWSTTEDNLATTKAGNSLTYNFKILELTTCKLVLSSTYTSPKDTYVEVLTFRTQ